MGQRGRSLLSHPYADYVVQHVRILRFHNGDGTISYVPVVLLGYVPVVL